MKKELYLVLGLLGGFGAGWYVNSSLKYDKFMNRIEEQILENKERIIWSTGQVKK